MRSVGGSMGVAVFGAIFSNRLGHELATRPPAQAHVPTDGSPGIVSHLPPAIHGLYVAAFSTALHPVFLTGSAIGLAAFALTWLLREVPLRDTAGAGGVGESFAAPRDSSSERALERIAAALVSGRGRDWLLDGVLARLGVHLSPAEASLLAQLGRCTPTSTRAELSERCANWPGDDGRSVCLTASRGRCSLAETRSLGGVAGCVEGSGLVRRPRRRPLLNRQPEPPPSGLREPVRA